jgi:L-threonylcarbamoyladenylate synthase
VSRAQIAHAVALLRGGGLVAFPTETVYGLGADATNADAVRRLYAVKGRPAGHPVIAHLGRAAALDEWAVDVRDTARALAATFWPGPLTLVVQRRPGTIVDEVTGGRSTVGLRVPAHPLALELLDAFGRPVAAPSANRFGKVSPTTAAHVRADLDGDVDEVLDGGPCRVGVESTIIDCTGDVVSVLRVGGVAVADIERVLGVPVALRTGGEVAAPGTLASHYAPAARVELVARAALAARHDQLERSGVRVVVLDVADVEEYARVLYRRLREADEAGADVVLAVPPEGDGLAAAVRDRLERAATPGRR